MKIMTKKFKYVRYSCLSLSIIDPLNSSSHYVKLDKGTRAAGDSNRYKNKKSGGYTHSTCLIS